jgi:hypothetical protein
MVASDLLLFRYSSAFPIKIKNPCYSSPVIRVELQGLGLSFISGQTSHPPKEKAYVTPTQYPNPRHYLRPYISLNVKVFLNESAILL